MTSHVVDKTKDQDDDDENEQEEEPEDGNEFLDEIKEQNAERLNSRQSYKGRRDSQQSVIGGDSNYNGNRDPNNP